MKKLIAILAFLAGFSTAIAEIPERPDPPKLVNDFAGILDNQEVSSLESQLVQFARETSTQIVVAIVPDLEGYDISDYAYRLGEKWGVGQQGKNNGLVIMVKPKTGNEQGRVFIATGYGLEGVLPDAVVNGTVIDKEMIPYFKQNDYYGGLASGANVIMDIARGEYTAEDYQESASQGSGISFFIVLIVFFIIFSALRGRKRRFYSPGKNLPWWIALGMLSGNRTSGGGFSDFSSGRGGFGGFGGSGGFGGFGGGSFGGGGAGGSW